MLGAPTDCRITDCDFSNLQKGIYCSGATNGLHVARCRFKNMRNNSVHVSADPDGGSNIWIECCESDEQNTNQSPYYVSAGGNGIFRSVHIINNKAHGKNLAFSQDGSADLFSLKDLEDGHVIGNHAAYGR